MRMEKVLTKQQLITMYEKKLKDMIIMDDYDGGQAEMLRTVIEDLRSTVKNEAEKELDY
tara:strand:- start:261 stop:437 length:177 start_codon:yes stop_codon:yes gene_type:complete